MLLTIVQDWVSELEAHLEELEQALRRDLDFSRLEQELCERLNVLGARVLEPILGKLLQEADYLADLKHLGGRLAMRFKEYRRVRVRLANGQYIQVWAPYFLKACPKGSTPQTRSERTRGVSGARGVGFYRSGECFVGKRSSAVSPAMSFVGGGAERAGTPGYRAQCQEPSSGV